MIEALKSKLSEVATPKAKPARKASAKASKKN